MGEMYAQGNTSALSGVIKKFGAKFSPLAGTLKRISNYMCNYFGHQRRRWGRACQKFVRCAYYNAICNSLSFSFLI